MQKILIISKKHREADKAQLAGQRYNPIFSDRASIIDLPPQISEVLINNHTIIFKAISWCMFPIIWAGDTLKIEPIKPQDARIGDIVLYKYAAWAFAHRLVRTYTEKDRLYIVTSGEREFRNNQFNNFRGVSLDNYSGVPSDNILGRVIEIKRGKSCFQPDKANESLGSLMQGRIRLSLWILKRKAKQYIAIIFIKLQRLKLYRYCFRGLIKNKVSFLVGTPITKNTGEINNFRFYQALEHFSKNLADTEGLYNISATINNRPIGNISLFLERTDNRKVCTLPNFIVRIPFRGLGIGRQLLGKALYLCKRINVDEIKVNLSEKNKVACKLFLNSGFNITR